MKLSDTLKTYLSGTTATQLLASNDVTNFLFNSFALLSNSDFKQLVELLTLKYDNIFEELHKLFASMFEGTTIGEGDILLSDKITNIPSLCFSQSSVESITGNNVTVLSSKCFSNCENLRTINFPNIELIGSSVFSNCKYLKSVTLPNSLERVGPNAFAGCTELKEIIYEGTIEECGKVDWWTLWDGSAENTNIRVMCSDGQYNFNKEIQ